MQPNIGLESLIGAQQPVIFLNQEPLALSAVPAVAEVAPREVATREMFVWTLAHELRQPLSVLSTAVALVRQEAVSDTTIRAIDMMGRQIEQMSRIIEDLVDAARLKHGKVSLQLRRLDLRTVAADAAIDVAADVAERRHTLDFDAGTIPLWVRADPQRMHQVFSNLLRNSVKYTDRLPRASASA